MDFGYTEEEEKFRERLAKFLDKELTEEIARQNWEDLGVGPEAREFSLKLSANGFLGMGWPKEYGGQGLPPAYDFILLDELGKRWGAHVPLDIGYTMVGPTILRRGSDASPEPEPAVGERSWTPRSCPPTWPRCDDREVLIGPTALLGRCLVALDCERRRGVDE